MRSDRAQREPLGVTPDKLASVRPRSFSSNVKARGEGSGWRRLVSDRGEVRQRTEFARQFAQVHRKIAYKAYIVHNLRETCTMSMSKSNNVHGIHYVIMHA